MKTLRAFGRALSSLRQSPTKFPEEPLGLSADEKAGFYAGTLNTTLNSRYNVIGKLGWGVHSSVWLARDIARQSHAHPSYAAIKILSAHATEVQGRLANELDILQRINTHGHHDANEHPGHKHVARLLDNFTVTDHHGPHLCLVSEVLGGFNGSVRPPGQNLPVLFVKTIARQLLLALDFLHRECGIVHTDLKPDNILFRLPNAEETVERYTTEKPGSVPLTPIIDSPLPIVLSRPITPYTLDDLKSANQASIEVQLTDFGTAAMVDGFHANIIQPYALRAPEVILGNGWTTSADIWNLGCLIFEFLTGNWLFQPRSGPKWSVEDYHLDYMPHIAGEEFDITYIRKGKYFDKYFMPEGHPRIQFQRTYVDLEEALDNYKVLDNIDKPYCVSFLRSMLRLKPSDRASAAELLEHVWIKPLMQ